MSTGATGTPAGPFGYAGGLGYQEDNDSGLKLLGHRYCDASTGRFITRDPAQDGRNWYAYAGNSPTNAVDPSGFSAMGLPGGPMVEGGSPGAPLDFGNPNDYDPYDGGYWSFQKHFWRGFGGGAVGAVKGLPAAAMSSEKIFYNPIGSVEDSIDMVKGACNLAAQCADGDPNALGDATFQGTAAYVTHRLGKIGCFVAGTQVLMADGSTKPIEQIRIGDAVASRSDKAGPNDPIEPKTVTGTSVHFDAQIESITLGDGTKLETTPEHPFYVAGHGFQAAKYLRTGSNISEGNESFSTVARTAFPKAGSSVFNFTVEDDHTYFVVDHGHPIWVHNGTCSRIGKGVRSAQRRAYWKAKDPSGYAPEDVESMSKGNAPMGSDGFPMELHHPNGDPNATPEEMTLTDHRGRGNFKKNHPYLYPEE